MKSPRNNDSLLEEIPNQELVLGSTVIINMGNKFTSSDSFDGCAEDIQMFRIQRCLNEEFLKIFKYTSLHHRLNIYIYHVRHELSPPPCIRLKTPGLMRMVRYFHFRILEYSTLWISRSLSCFFL